ncbi:MurR/RpiR family transcriptional regulator [Paenibacillus sp. WLX1005]|uniref:MurR/RpiR family transcriptional regulator n=1 Tax=Paenibacillus sp. WLX1005 TaxID=3243766 RepID=UPI0039843E3E
MTLWKTMKYTQNLTAQERHVVDYILQQPQAVFEQNAQQLARLTLTSASTIVRLCKKLGLNGYPDFQLKLALELSPEQRQHGVAETMQTAGVEGHLQTISSVYDEALIETQRMCIPAVMQKVMDWIKAARRIDIYGSDSNYYTAELACARWNEIGVTAIAQNNANHHYLSSPHIDPSTLSFIISHTGRNRSMLDIARTLKSNGRRIVALTVDGSPLAELSDYTLYTYAQRPGTLGKMYSMMSAQYLFDVLYAGTMPEDMELVADRSDDETL